MSAWIKLNRMRLNIPKISLEHGVRHGSLVSPFDVPEAIRADYVADRQTVLLTLKYGVAEEPLLEKRIDESTIFRVGRKSGRIYEIEIDLKKIDRAIIHGIVKIPDALAEAIEAMNSFSSHTDQPWRRGNYRLVQEAIRDKEAELVEQAK